MPPPSVCNPERSSTAPLYSIMTNASNPRLYPFFQVELALSVEEQFPVRLRRFFIIGSREIQPNRNLTPWEKFRYTAWGGERFDSSEKISNALHPPMVTPQTPFSLGPPVKIYSDPLLWASLPSNHRPPLWVPCYKFISDPYSGPPCTVTPSLDPLVL